MTEHDRLVLALTRLRAAVGLASVLLEAPDADPQAVRAVLARGRDESFAAEREAAPC